jgi:hypothetical protein
MRGFLSRPERLWRSHGKQARTRVSALVRAHTQVRPYDNFNGSACQDQGNA